MLTTEMSNDNLSVYLNDHLAGSVAGLEILDQLCDLLKDHAFAAEIASLRAEVASDRDALEGIIERLEFTPSRVRKASGWLAEKAVAVKLLVDDPKGGPLRIFESLEALSLGIEGKRSLWKALASVSGRYPPIKLREIELLHERAVDQRQRVESMRLGMAQEAFGSPKESNPSMAAPSSSE